MVSRNGSVLRIVLWSHELRASRTDLGCRRYGNLPPPNVVVENWAIHSARYAAF